MTDTDAAEPLAQPEPLDYRSQPDLVLPSDLDWASFKAQDESWFLRAASDEVRRYCGWHLTPSVTETVTKLPIGERGIIMLPTRHLTAVTTVKVKVYVDEPAVVVDPNTYEWQEPGWIQALNWSIWPYQGSYYYGYGPAYLPVYQAGSADVTFTHGWPQLPDDIKTVVMELAAQGSILSQQSNVAEIASPGYKLKLRDAGLSLSEGQKSRLASYKIGSTK